MQEKKKVRKTFLSKYGLEVSAGTFCIQIIKQGSSNQLALSISRATTTAASHLPYKTSRKQFISDMYNSNWKAPASRTFPFFKWSMPF